MRAFDQRTKRFYLFTVFGFAWGMLAIALATPHVPSAYLAGFIAISPFFAAYILHITNYNNSFFTHIFIDSRPNGWWFAAVIVPLLFCFVLLSSFTLTANSLLFNPFIWMLVFAAALFQEIGWRGFLQRELSRLSFWPSSLLVGLISACWHVPIALILFETSDALLFMLTLYFLLSAGPLALIVATTKSVFPSALMQSGLFMLLLLTTGYAQATIVFFAMLVMLNGLVMLINAVFPTFFWKAFIIQ